MKKPVFADLNPLAEPDRIAIIAETLRTGNVTGFIVEDDAKADRYIAAIQALTTAIVTFRGPFVDGAILVRMAPPAHPRHAPERN